MYEDSWELKFLAYREALIVTEILKPFSTDSWKGRMNPGQMLKK
jgi:hypothetical protein